jgi:hypothetical protein
MLLLVSLLLCVVGLWREKSNLDMLIHTLVPVLCIEGWVWLNRVIKRYVKTKQAEAIAIGVIHTAFAAAVSNNIAFFFTPWLVTMRSYEAATFFCGYGLFRFLSSLKEDGRKLNLHLLVWIGSVAGGGVAINSHACALQMAWERNGLAIHLAVIALIILWVANKYGDPLDEKEKEKVESSTIAIEEN